MSPSVAKPKPNTLANTKDPDNTVNQLKLEVDIYVDDTKRRKTCSRESCKISLSLTSDWMT